MSKLKNLNVSESFDTYESEKVLNECRGSKGYSNR